jgi:dihydrofolate synthase/folylpolyglutamate synthase
LARISYSMNNQQALDKLFSLHQFGIKLGLENITNLCNHIGNPQNNLKAFHIAGSNGKGSTASFMASILQESGYKVGLFTSPHFVNFTERIRINGKMISEEYVCNFMNELNTYIDEHKPTFFELTTAMAFKYFDENEIDYAVIETGLGGRLDATNVLNPIASIITSISHEHSNILGDTLSKIAGEKAGIIKDNSKVFITNLANEAEEKIIEIAKSRKSEIFLINNYLKSNGDSIQLEIDQNKFSFYNLPLKGEFQYFNAGIAILTLLKSNIFLDNISILNGIDRVKKNSGIWGRYEIYSEAPKIIFDSAHNIEGVENFLSEFRKENQNYNKKTLLFGAMKDKNLEEILNKLVKYFDDIVVTSIDYERAAKNESLVKILNSLNYNCTVENSPSEFILNFQNRNENECLVVLGSIYIIGEIKRGLE